MLYSINEIGWLEHHFIASWQLQKIPEDSQYRENVEQWFNFITKVTTEKDNVRDWRSIACRC